MKFRLTLCVIALSVLICATSLFAKSKNHTIATEQIAVPSPVYAQTNNNTVLYDSKNGNAADLIADSSRVEIISDENTQWYYIRFKNKLGWVKKENLVIPSDIAASIDYPNQKELENYANQNFDTKTEQYVWVDIYRQKTYVFKNTKSGWQIENIITCSTGKNISPTIRGNFKIGDRGEWFFSEKHGSGAMYWVRFKGSYLFHSVAMDKNKKVIDATLGEKSSNGCVRMSVENAKWFYENIKEGTPVWVN